MTDAKGWRRAATVVPLAFVAALVVNGLVLQDFPNSGDEFAYVWQAMAFADGQVTARSPEPAEAFRQNHLGDVNGRRFSKYPPGWPLLLSVAVRAGWPPMANALLSALALAGICRLACSWVGPRAALSGTLLIGASPFFLLNAASYHSHPSCLFALTTLAVALAVAAERPSWWACALAGAGFGLAVIIRPYTALLIGVPLSVGLGRAIVRAPGRFWPRLAWFIAGGAPFALLLALINAAATGSWWVLAWTYFDASETLGFTSYGHSIGHGFRTTLRLCAEGFVYTSLVTVPVLLAARGQQVRHARLLWITLWTPIVGYAFWWSHGGNRYGPRFYFEALLPFTILVGAGLDRLARRWPPLRLWTALAAATIVMNIVIGARVAGEIFARRDVYRVVAAAGLRRAVVLLRTASADMVRIDLNRNPPNTADAPVLFGLADARYDHLVVRAHPERQVYYYAWRPEGGVLTPFSAGPGPVTR